MPPLKHYLTSELVSSIKTVVLAVIVLSAVIALLFILRKLYGVYFLLKAPLVSLEVTPPAREDKTIEATNELFQAVHGLGRKRLLDRLLGRQYILALEITANKQTGIRYIVSATDTLAKPLEYLIISYLPSVKVRQIETKDTPVTKQARVLEYRQSRHFAYPLKNLEALHEHDPIGYITNAMTKLKAGEQLTWQMIIHSAHVRSLHRLNRKILTNDAVVPTLGGSGQLLGKSTAVINRLLLGLMDIVSGAYHTTAKETYRAQHKDMEYKQQVAKGIKPVRTLSYFEHELVESIHRKLEQPLFNASIRMLIHTKDKTRLLTRRRSIESALAVYAQAQYQRLRLSLVKYKLLPKLLCWQFANRLPVLNTSRSNILSAAEVAGLYHFPNTISSKTENIIKSLSRTLPAPVSLKNGQPLDVLFGENIHQGSTTPIGLTQSERERHVYIIGGTGNGKTTMLLYSILQDIKNGKGLAVLDPHGDLAETILHHIPKHRINDVIYLNPDDLTHPIGINLLEMTPELEGDDLLREKDLITESTISVLRKIFSEDDSGGHRIEYVLRNTIQTALTMENPTLFTIFKLLNDNKFRREVVKTLKDEDLKNFWKNELGKAGDFQKVKMVAGITAKIGRFLFSASAKRILEQEKSTVDFSEILDSSKILICNFSKGLLGEDTSTLFGTTILAKLQVASLRRARLKQTERCSFYLYVDEFQNFATMSFVQMLSEARKYKLFLTMAEQSTSQQDQQRLVDIILANVGTVICFRSGSPADERYVLPLFYPYIEQGEIANLPAYNFYMRIAAVEAQEPLSGMTVLIDQAADTHAYAAVIQNSRKQYANPPDKSTTTAKASKAPKATRPVKPKGNKPAAKDLTPIV